jgi:phosphoribosylformimino-5-aminoimidazole carboxamide ribotide isomerase
MIIYPAMDILERKIVKLDGTHRVAEKVYGTPEEIAERWISAGAKWLHVVDLDGALGTGSNDVPIIQLVPKARAKGVQIQVGGGIRDDRRLTLFAEGKFAADRIVVGTRAVREPDWLERIATKYPYKIIAAIDAKGHDIVVAGWQESAGLKIEEFVRRACMWPVAGFLYTNVKVEGLGKGVDWEPIEHVISVSPRPVIVSGGVSSLDDVRRFKELGAHGVIVGSALYNNRFTFEEAQAIAL